jgi:hypothetical protein
MQNSQKEQSAGWTLRYFLRRFALARKSKDAGAAYSSALFEVVLVAVVAPSMAIFSCAIITSVKWAPALATRWSHFSPKLTGVIIAVMSFAVGKALFDKRLQRYRDNSEAYRNFGSDLDERAVFWQKLSIVSICGLVLPLLAVFSLLLP